MKNYVNPEMQMLSLDSCDIVTTSVSISDYTRVEDGVGNLIFDCKDL